MVEYGYLDENGIMTSKMLESYSESYRDEDGELKERTVSIEEQAYPLIKQGWKPVDLIDESQMITEEGFSIEIIPYDADGKISYRYKKVFDKKAITEKIKKLKNRLSSTESDIGDYKITKCYEASLSGEPLPYDIKFLKEERQKVRNRINELENFLKQEEGKTYDLDVK